MIPASLYDGEVLGYAKLLKVADEDHIRAGFCHMMWWSRVEEQCLVTPEACIGKL
jgi:hypothetical protein